MILGMWSTIFLHSLEVRRKIFHDCANLLVVRPECEMFCFRGRWRKKYARFNAPCCYFHDILGNHSGSSLSCAPVVSTFLYVVGLVGAVAMV